MCHLTQFIRSRIRNVDLGLHPLTGVIYDAYLLSFLFLSSKSLKAQNFTKGNFLPNRQFRFPRDRQNMLCSFVKSAPLQKLAIIKEKEEKGERKLRLIFGRCQYEQILECSSPNLTKEGLSMCR